MLRRLEGGATPRHVAQCYAGLIDALVIDEADADGAADVDIPTVVTSTLMRDAGARRALAETALNAVALA
jgi:LPPG:FO 2-phospho-L-lactate transferase